MPAHKIEWVDGTTIELESSTHTETGLRLVFKDERIFEVDVVEPISAHKRWKTFKLVCVCKAVETEIGELVPCPTSSWGKRVEKLWKPKVQEGEEREVTELALIGFSGFELNKSGGLEQQSITHFALFESTQDRQLIVGVRNVRESQPQKDELHSQIQGEVIREGEKTRKHAEEMGHSLKEEVKGSLKSHKDELHGQIQGEVIRQGEKTRKRIGEMGYSLGGKMKGPIKLAEEMIPILDKQKEVEHDESKVPGGKARDNQRREEEANDPYVRKLLSRMPSCIKNRRKIILKVELHKIAEELAISLTRGQRLSPWMEKEIKKVPKAKRESMKKTFRKWIHEASAILDSPGD